MSCTCPICELSVGGRYFAAVIGSCKKCGEYTPYSAFRYCRACAIKLNKCNQCGVPIKACKEYILPYKAALDESLDGYKRLVADTKMVSMKDIYEREIVRGEAKYELFVKYFDNDKPMEETMTVLAKYIEHIKKLF